jgi:hypothetical protein
MAMPISAWAYTEHFGVDGENIKYMFEITKLKDGCSSSNGARWQMFEPTAPVGEKHNYDWSKSDIVISTAQNVGRELQVNVSVFSDWAIDYDKDFLATDDHTGKRIPAIKQIKPQYLSSWTKFISAFLERYDADGIDDMPGLKRPAIIALQIESEVENYWSSVNGYIQALSLARNAAHKVAPAVKIMAGGFNSGEYFAMPDQIRKRLLENPFVRHKIMFYRDFLARGKNYFDILSLHLNRSYESIPPTVAWFVNGMKEHGYKKTIWSDDMCSGQFLSSESASPRAKEWLLAMEAGNGEALKWYEQEQANYLIKKAVLAFASGVERVFISTDCDWKSYFMPVWRHMGLISDNDRLKPAYQAVKIMVQLLDGFTEVRPVNVVPPCSCYKFVTSKGIYYVVWSTHDQKINLPIKADMVKVLSPAGIATIDKAKTFHVYKYPVFVYSE